MYHLLFDKRAYVQSGGFRAGRVVKNYFCRIVNSEFREVSYDKLCRVINNDICKIVINDIHDFFNDKIHSFVGGISRVFDDIFYQVVDDGSVGDAGCGSHGAVDAQPE
jgi:hypothetical protein